MVMYSYTSQCPMISHEKAGTTRARYLAILFPEASGPGVAGYITARGR